MAMKKRAHVIYSLIVTLVSLVVFSCDQKRDELVYFPNKRPDHLVPILNMNEEAKYLCELIFDGLVNKTTVRDGREHYQWALVAEEGYREEDPWNRKLITIYLKKGVLWHDGREFTADDVIYTIKAIRQSSSPLNSWLNTFIEWIKPVEGNNYKIKMKLKVERSKEAFMELFAPIKILPKWYTYQGRQIELPFNLNDGSEVSREFEFSPVGTGPYRIKERGTQERVLLSVNQTIDYRYHLLTDNATDPGAKFIRMEVEKDPIKAVKELKKGLGLIFDVKEDFFKDLQDEPLDYQTYLPYSFYAIIYDTRKSPFNDHHFRKAVTCATNKEELAKKYIAQPDLMSRQVINWSIFPASSGYIQFNPDGFLEANTFNVHRARQYLSNSTVENRKFRLLICSQYDGERAKRLAETYKGMMNAIGIEIEIDDVSAPLYDSKLDKGDFDAAFYEFKGFDHLFDLRSLFGRGELNYWQVYDNNLEALLNSFAATLDWEERVRLAQQIHTRIDNITPGCFLFTVPRRAYYSKRLTNVSVHPEVGFSTVETWILR